MTARVRVSSTSLSRYVDEKALHCFCGSSYTSSLAKRADRRCANSPFHKLARGQPLDAFYLLERDRLLVPSGEWDEDVESPESEAEGYRRCILRC